ncbi:MAG: hypothetical protein KDC28_13735 [Saprospiraceae bacterium]|nr:hypothetical protein [Saprospiraceae bacterium]MCB9319038.1 hypothetical protein [Lewinellaceae bacterium]
MEEVDNSNKGKIRMNFLIAFVICAGLLIFKPEFFWIALPFTLTYLVQAFDVI